jgi:hypothetical protein
MMLCKMLLQRIRRSDERTRYHTRLAAGRRET